MIKINLATRKTAAIAQGTVVGTKGAFGGLGKVSIDLETLREMPNLKGLLLLVVCWYGGGEYWAGHQAEVIGKYDLDIAAYREKQAQITTRLEESKTLEATKKSLEADEKVLKTKFEVITKLMEDRSTPARILTTLSQITPKDIWLDGLTLDTTSMTVRGSSLDFSPVSEFMKSLKETVFFQDAILRSSQQAKEQDLDVTRFELSVERRKKE